MGKSRPGRKYPHVTTDAKPHDHTYCPQVFRIAARAAAGREQWGTLHTWTTATREEAQEASKGFYRARSCRQRPEDLPLLSVSSKTGQAGSKWRVTLQVWDRRLANAEIVRRVNSGEPLAYNTLRRKVKEQP